MISREVAEDILRDRPPQVRAAILEQIEHETIEHQADELANHTENVYNRILGPTINYISETRMRFIAYFSKDLPLLCLIHFIYVMTDIVGVCFLLFLPDKEGYMVLWILWITVTTIVVISFFYEAFLYYNLINRAYSNNDIFLQKITKMVPFVLLLASSFRFIVFLVFCEQCSDGIRAIVHFHNGILIFNYSIILMRTIDFHNSVQLKINTTNRIHRIDIEMRGEPTNTEC